jgi:hypothetical protein
MRSTSIIDGIGPAYAAEYQLVDESVTHGAGKLSVIDTLGAALKVIVPPVPTVAVASHGPSTVEDVAPLSHGPNETPGVHDVACPIGRHLSSVNFLTSYTVEDP